jgi:hypothetical protein
MCKLHLNSVFGRAIAAGALVHLFWREQFKSAFARAAAGCRFSL